MLPDRIRCARLSVNIINAFAFYARGCNVPLDLGTYLGREGGMH